MKKHFLLLIPLCSILGTGIRPAGLVCNDLLVKSEVKRLNQEVKDDNFNYTFDTNGEFKGKSDPCETSVGLSNTDSTTINTFEDGRKEYIYFKGTNVNTCAEDESKTNNDSFEYATIVYALNDNICPSESHTDTGGTISQKTSGWGPWKKTYIDKDFFRYDIVVTGTFEVLLTNIPSGCDYDLRLYKMTNDTSTSYENMNFDSNYLISAKGGNTDERIFVDNVTPGTYYAVVYSYKDATWNNDSSYSLSFEQVLNQDRDEAYYDIKKGREEKKDLCAIWTSDYKPLGYTPTSVSDSESKVYFKNIKTYPYIQQLYNYYETKDLVFAKIYVWDLGLRATIYEIFDQILDFVINEAKWKETEYNRVSIALKASKIVISLGKQVVSTISYEAISAAASTALAGLGIGLSIAGFAVSIAALIVCMTMRPTFNISKQNLREYLINAKAGFEVGRGTSDQEVVMLRYRYHFGYDSKAAYFDFSPVYRTTDNNLYNKGYINCFDDESCISGSVKGCKSYDELKEYLQ